MTIDIDISEVTDCRYQQSADIYMKTCVYIIRQDIGRLVPASTDYFSAGFPDNDGVLNICQPLRVFSNDTLPKWAQNNTPASDIDGDRRTYRHYTVLPIYPHTF